MGVSALRPYERRVLVALSDGSTRSEAAARLGITRSTISTEIASAFRALEVQSLVEAYYRLGWLRVPEEK